MLEKDMVFAEVKVNRKDEKAFVIKEEIFNALTIGEAPTLESRVIVFEGDHKDQGYALLVMFKLNRSNDLIYGTWFNNIEDKHIKMLEHLRQSDDLYISVVDENNIPVSTFVAENKLKFTANNYLKSAKFNDIHEWKSFTSKVRLTQENRVTLFDECKFYDI